MKKSQLFVEIFSLWVYERREPIKRKLGISKNNLTAEKFNFNNNL